MVDESPISASCPRCDEPISSQHGHCPSCGLDFLDEEGGLSQDAIDAMLDDADITSPQPRPGGRYYTPRWVRLLIGLAISVPMGPLTMFIAESAAPIPLWVAALTFLLGWIVPGVVLSTRAVPSVIVATGLLVLGVTLAITPVVIVGARAVLDTDASEIGALGTNVLAAQTAFMAVGLVVIVLGTIVYRHATAKRRSWAEQAAQARR